MRRPRFAHKRCFDSFPAFLSSLHQKQPSISILISNISTPDQIEEMFANRDVPAIFHTYLADPIDVTVVGQDFHVGGNYKSMQAFHEGIYARVAAALKVDTIRVEVRRVIGGGEASWAAVESLCTAESKYGEFGLATCELFVCVWLLRDVFWADVGVYWILCR